MLRYFCSSVRSGTSLQPRLVQKITWPVFSSATPGMPTPMEAMSFSSKPPRAITSSMQRPMSAMMSS